MKVHFKLLPLLITALSIVASGQCAKPGINPIWDPVKEQFRCIDPAVTTRSAQDEAVSPTGNKDFCKNARENLQKVCPTSDQGNTCRNTAKSIFEACYKSPKTDSNRGGATNPSPASRVDSSACMATFRDQQQACQSRKTPPPSPGQPYVPDTCLADAMAAQNKCLAKAQ
jgi:hypothetical protein